ncbi:MAG: hypothetical protein HYR83_03520 [Planctomycetes bacterium]|nr:hypothetical protein [Planctomycetota bacterium]
MVLAGSGNAWGQSCGPGSPAAVDCDPGLEHGNGGTAACQNRCVGETLNCTGTFRYLDQLLDPVLVKGAFDTVHGNVRDPASGNLSIILISGNAVCTDSGGACNNATGANCAFPCLVGPGGKGCSDAGTGLSLPAAPQNGSVRVADRNLYTILASDIGNLGNTFTFTQRDLCDSACSDCPANDDSATASSSTLVPNCNDNDSCTNDSCAVGACSHTPVTCDDQNACTSDACNPANGQCVFTPNVTCNDSNACTDDSCNPATGQCVFTPNIVCNDSNACTDDTCNPANGQCVYTPNITCNDNNACTDDSCNPATGQCVFTPNIVCNDNNGCTADSCNPANGQCVYTPNVSCDSCHTCNPATGVCEDNGTCAGQIGCRITGGRQVLNGTIDPGPYDELIKGTGGGQVGAPCGCIGCFTTPDPNDDLAFQQIQGNWQYSRKNRQGTFHAIGFNSLICGCDVTSPPNCPQTGVAGAGFIHPVNFSKGETCGDREVGPTPPAAPANIACFSGLGGWTPTNGKKDITVAFRVEVEDRGEPSTGTKADDTCDVMRIRIWIPAAGEDVKLLADGACCTNSNPVGQAARLPNIDDGGNLLHGNLQIHTELHHSTDGVCPVPNGSCQQ